MSEAQSAPQPHVVAREQHQQPPPPQPCHLVVMQHGLWGNAGNLAFLEGLLHQHVQSLAASEPCGVSCPVRTLNCESNPDKLTYDGIDVCGDRLVADIRATVKRLLDEENLLVTKLSFIGYSLGGLIARYAVGKLEHEGALAGSGDGSKDFCFTPVNFVTIATPHLGAWRFGQEASFLKRLYLRTYHKLVPVIASMTGHQLMLKDTHAWERPLLMNMSDPSLAFYQGLQRFQTLTLLANAHHDHMVPYRTAAIVMSDPYEGHLTAPAQDPLKYPSVVRPCNPDEASARPMGGRWFPYVFFALLPFLLPVVIVVLAVMSWQGRQHYAALLRQGIAHGWLLSSVATPQSVEEKVQHGDDLPAAADLEQGSDSGAEAEAEAEAEAVQLVVVEEGPKAPALASGGTTPKAAAVALAAAPLAPATCTLSAVLEKQQWIVDHLNRLPWLKIDVDAGHGHAHAAIVLRIPKRFKHQDHLHYLFSKMQW